MSAPGQKPGLAGGSQLEIRLAQTPALTLHTSAKSQASIVWLWLPASAEF